MKTQLTIEESAKLIELGIDAKLASKCDSAMKVCASGRGIIRLPESRPIFDLTDILSILPKEIDGYGLDISYAKDGYYVSYIIWDNTEDYDYIRDSLQDKPISAPELIDALNSLLIWTIKQGHLKTERK